MFLSRQKLINLPKASPSKKEKRGEGIFLYKVIFGKNLTSMLTINYDRKVGGPETAQNLPTLSNIKAFKL